MGTIIDVGTSKTDVDRLSIENQKLLIDHGFKCPNSESPLQPVWDIATAGPGRAKLAVIDGCDAMLMALADRDLDRAKARWNGEISPGISPVLVLIAPALPWDAFLPMKSPATIPARALDAVHQTIVLFCPNDTTAQARMVGPNSQAGRRCMANAGLAPGTDPRVIAIDISGLIEDRANSARGALCSYEAMGLIVRLLKGVPPEAAITPAAKIQSAN